MRPLSNLLCAGLVAIAAGVPASAADTSPAATQATLGSVGASVQTRRMAAWVMASEDNSRLPFIIVDKVDARVFVFDGDARLSGSAPALLGLARGDVSPPGIGSRTLASIRPAERITPAGRFVAALGSNLGAQDVLWVDYEGAVSLHRIATSKASEQREQRLASATAVDNRISYGCINVAVTFYEKIVRPAFAATHGIVYILPETRSVDEQFGIPTARPHPGASLPWSPAAVALMDAQDR